jgi:hypothetical protein
MLFLLFITTDKILNNFYMMLTLKYKKVLEKSLAQMFLNWVKNKEQMHERENYR